MKTLYAVSALLFCCINLVVSAQSPNWHWAAGPGGASPAFAPGICTDAAGNSYVTGIFDSGSIIFGPNTLTASGSVMFVAKYDASGNALWAKSLGSNPKGYSMAICLNPQGGFYVTGRFVSTQIILGPDTLHGTGAGYSNMFIARLDTLGNVLWARGADGAGGSDSHGSTLGGLGLAICSDINGNAFVTGSYDGNTTTFGTQTPPPATQGAYFYLVKYDNSGNALWVSTAGGPGAANGSGVCADANGNVYVHGSFTDSTLTFGDTTLINNSIYYGNIFVVKYTESGSVGWAKCSQATGYAQAGAIVYDGGANLFISAAFDNSFLMGADTLSDGTSGDYDLVLVKCDTSGNILFTKDEAFLGYNFYSLSAVAMPDGGISVTSAFQYISQMVLANNTIINPDSDIIQFYAARFDSSGNAIWSIGVDDTFGAEGYGIGADAEGNVYVVGNFSSPGLSFQIGNSVLTAPKGHNMFAGRIDYTPAAISQVQGDGDFIYVYPNPSAGQFWFNGTMAGDKLEVYDLVGHLIYLAETTVNNYTLNLTGKAAGIYIYKITGTNNLGQTGKIVVEQ